MIVCIKKEFFFFATAFFSSKKATRNSIEFGKACVKGEDPFVKKRTTTSTFSTLLFF